jgi:hypothetical protein
VASNQRGIPSPGICILIVERKLVPVPAALHKTGPGIGSADCNTRQTILEESAGRNSSAQGNDRQSSGCCPVSGNNGIVFSCALSLNERGVFLEPSFGLLYIDI